MSALGAAERLAHPASFAAITPGEAGGGGMHSGTTGECAADDPHPIAAAAGVSKAVSHFSRRILAEPLETDKASFGALLVVWFGEVRVVNYSLKLFLKRLQC